MHVVNIRPAGVPAFPVGEFTDGIYAICPVCRHQIHPDDTNEAAHYLREHRGVTPTAGQYAAARQVIAETARPSA